MAVLVSQNAIALSFVFADLKGAIDELMQAKSWSKPDYELSQTVLSYVPYFVFHYTSFSESKDQEEGGGKELVDEASAGVLALNGKSGELETEMADELDGSELQEFVEPAKKKTQFDVQVQKMGFSSKEMERLALLKTAKELGLPRSNVEVSSFKLVYYPIWTTTVVLDEGDFELRFSGGSGDLLSEDDIPSREKGKTELASETIGELSSPAKWGEYAINIVKDIYKNENLRKVGKFLVKDKRGQIILLLLIIYVLLRLVWHLSWP